MNELREIQNGIFGIARGIKGIQNDLNTRHKSRAREKIHTLHDRFYSLSNIAYVLWEDMR